MVHKEEVYKDYMEVEVEGEERNHEVILYQLSLSLEDHLLIH